MKKILSISLAIFLLSSVLYAQNEKSPFGELGYKKKIMYTSSKGEFDEFHDQANVVEIGSVYFDTKTNKTVGFVAEEKGNSDVSPATTATSIDPNCEKYYWISTYAYCSDNPVRLVDPNGEDVYRYNENTGNLNLAKKTDDKFDQIGKFKYDKKTDTYTLKTDKKGNAKTYVANIEKGILKDGINFKKNDNVINIGGKNQATVKGFENFVLNFANFVDKEISGYYMSNKNESSTNYVYVSKYVNNTATEAHSSYSLYNVRPDLYNSTVVTTDFHTHLSRFDDASRLTPSDADKNTKESDLLNGIQNFIIITNPENVHY